MCLDETDDGGGSFADLLARMRGLLGPARLPDDPAAQLNAAPTLDPGRLRTGLFGSGWARYMAERNMPQPPVYDLNHDPFYWHARAQAAGQGRGGGGAAPPPGTGAEFGPQASGIEADRPIVDPADNHQVAGPVTGRPYPASLDPIVDSKVAGYNKMNQADPGDTIYLDPDRLRAMLRVETAHDRKAADLDPMQVNNAGDWVPEKADIGLKRGVSPGADLSIDAALKWFDQKSYYFDAKGQPGLFIGWDQAIRRYNGGGDPHYLEKVKKAYQDIKSGR